MFSLSVLSSAVQDGLKKAWVPAIVLLCIALVFAILIVILSKVLAVPVDEKVEEVKNNLAGANCGACGYAGCADFAKALCEGKAELSSCSVTSKDQKSKISDILGVTIDEVETRVIVRCQGGQACKDSFVYTGYSDCKSANALNGGAKACKSGCLGLATCTSVCPTNAIIVKENKVARVDDSKCINCGLCINNCPKNVIDRVPKTAQVLVACTNTGRGKDVRDICEFGCIGCSLCSRVCPEKCITMVNNLPVINYELCKGCKACVKKCPRGTIIEI